MNCVWRTCKWLFLQVLLYSLMPYVWDYEYGVETLSMMALYTALYVVYGEVVPRQSKMRLAFVPYVVYAVIATLLFYLVEAWSSSLFACLVLPLYGFLCLLIIRICQRTSKKLAKQYKVGGKIIPTIVILLLVILKIGSVAWVCKSNGSFESERVDIIERRNYLVHKLVTSPHKVVSRMPRTVGPQFQGEWALYSCSMLSASLVNISHLYPETREENIQHIDSLISIVMSPELRHYDTMRWGEDPLESLNGDNSHISYLSHLAWMMCGYKEMGGGDKYDDLLAKLCETMNRRLCQSRGFNLPTYPNEPIYIPDMLVAIVALDKYADLSGGTYRSTVGRWIERAKRDWLDEDTGLLMSFLNEDGTKLYHAPVRGSYSALNCYYLTLIDEEFAREQYGRLKTLFWKDGFVDGLKEYWDRSCWLGVDIDAGPILLELSPSGTAFFAGPATYFNDAEVRNAILRTAEIAGHTIELGNKRHYLLANIALVGESIMLAMRTNED